ncbi:MAG TPA: D-alanine--D-alanine ligase [Thermoanaerobaculia bacterium]|nr:D-alanine--D-alanine ligase [Thermoanaerobaculia bacterium]
MTAPRQAAPPPPPAVRPPLRIALAYDLKTDYLAAGFSPEAVMEFDDETTVAALAAALAAIGHRPERVGRGVELARRLAAGDRWDLVFNFAEGVSGRSREAQVPALCELYEQPYTFSDPLTAALTLDKPLAKRVVRDLGLPTAPFAVVSRAEEADAVDLPLPLFVKPIAEGSSKGVSQRSKVTRREDLRGRCAELIAAFAQPVLVEAYLPGREITVGIVGNFGNGAAARALGTMEIRFITGSDREFYTALNKGEFEQRVSYTLLDGEPVAARAREVALAAYEALGCRDAGRVDLRCAEDGEPQFLEINPLPGLHPIRSDLPIMCALGGVEYRHLVEEIVAAAARRWGLRQ